MPLIPYEFDAERFSRWMSYVLRHNPARYGLQPDRHGYVNLEEFFSIAKRREPTMTLERLRSLIEGGGAGRFEVTGGRLRARYGHSIPVEPPGPPVEPPRRLYHGTDAARSEVIRTEGLAPIDRRMVHLSETVEDAVAIARRKTDRPLIVTILAQEAHRAGITFFREGRVYLAAHIPPHLLQTEDVPVNPTLSP